ncbi:cell division protein ZapA [Aestuariivirga sp.]|uniref:cell division protein ZapA n=1 Tax=Aestuariivirga sp. TaxID=2650926 RepID=UPI0039E62704
MANVVVNIAGRPYTMQCPDGEEDHLKDLAKLLDTEVGRIRQSVGAIGDIRQLVMAGLMVADRLSEATRKLEDMQDQLDGLRISRDQALQQIKQQDENFAKALEIAAQKLEEMAQ